MRSSIKFDHIHTISNPCRSQAQLFVLMLVGAAIFCSTAIAREVRVGIYENEPKIFTDAANEPTGIFVDLLEAISKQQDWQLTYVKCEWTQCLNHLDDGSIDLMPDVAESAERHAIMDFHQTPALKSWSQLYRRFEVKIDSVTELEQKRVAVLKGSIQEAEFKNVIRSFGVTVELVSANAPLEVFELAKSGQADAAIANHYFGDFHAAEYDLEETSILFQPAKLYFATAKGRNQDLLSAIDQQLSTWQTNKNSEYFLVIKKWNSFAKRERLPAYVKEIFLFITLLLLMTVIITLVLRARLRVQKLGLIATNNQLKTTLDAMPDLLFEMDLHGRYLNYHSPQTELLVALPEVLIGKTLHEVLPADVVEVCMAEIHKANETGSAKGGLIRLDLPDGKHWFELSIAKKPVEGGKLPSFIVMSRDITERKVAEIKLARLTKLYSALSECNQAIVRCKTTEELFPIICHDAVHFGGMKMAWIGMLDEKSKLVKPVASFGTGTAYLEGLEISSDPSSPKGLGPTGTAVRENRPYWCQDFQHAPETSAWHEIGWGASAALPILCNNKVVGAFTLYASEVDAFDEAAQSLLVEMAMDISYALDRFAGEIQRKQVEMTLAESESRFREIFNSVTDAVFIHDAVTGKILDVNKRMCEMYGVTYAEALICTPDDLSEGVPPYTATGVDEKIKAASTGLTQTFEWHARAKDGHLFWTEVTLRFALIGNQRCILALVHDISERKLSEMALATSIHLLESVIDAIPMRIFWKDREGRYLGCNSRFARDAGETTPHDIIGKDDYQLGWKAQADQYRADDRRVVNSGLPKLFFVEPQSSSDGSTIWLRTSRVPLRSKENEIIGVLGTYDDITEQRNSEQKLIESAELLKESQSIASLGSYQLDFHTGLWTGSEVLDQMFGIDETFECSVDGWESIIHPDDRTMMDSYLKNEVIGKCKPFDKEYRIIRPTDQIERWVHGLGKLIFDANGVLQKMRGTIQDITLRKQNEMSMTKLTLAVDQSPNTIVITNLDARIEYTNSTFTKVTGYSLEEALGKNPRILQSGRTPQATYDDMWAHLTAGKEWRGELINRRKDGSEYIESAMISPVRQADGKITNYLAIKQDITAKRRDEERIEQLAHFDHLTGLPNRSLLNERFSYVLSLAQRSGESLAVMFLDLDHFKNINDTLGHSIGDRFLMEVATRLKATIRDEDTVSRLGGDEFILVFPGTDADAAAIVANKLMHAVSQPYQIDNHELIGTPSIGIAIYPNDGGNFEDLLKNADTAMYRVKQDSRNDFRFFTTEMQSHSQRNLQLVNAMRHALARNEFHLQYQPQITLSDGHIIGAEALLRWQHPELGSISPAEFIPIAEDSGQIIPIGEWVLRTAVKQMKDWLDSGLPPMVIAVNLSAVQFRQPNLPQLVTRILEEAQLLPEYLELELTEAVAMDDPQSAIAVMDKLFERGIRMSIDDFGTGYSSLSYLKRFKVNKLKIDQSFVRDISDDPEDKAIVTAIINLASSLGMHTIAEGVETASQLAFLRLQGCDEVQGYYFSKPLHAKEFETFVHNSR